MCIENQYVSNHKCEDCLPGDTRPAGDKTTDDDTECTKVLCAINEYVDSHLCTPCPKGSENPAGDPASGDDTTCEAILCPANMRVEDKVCVICPPGTKNDEGDNALGNDTYCDPITCGQNEHVVSHSCQACAAGITNAAGDDASGDDTACDELCPPDYYFDSSLPADNKCVACAPGTTSAGGYERECAPIICLENQHVVNYQCKTCVPGTENPKRDEATAGNTDCDIIYCSADQHVVLHQCIDCRDGETNESYDDASGDNTDCDVITCPTDQHVVNYECVPCPAGTTNASGDLATDGLTTCDIIYCTENQYVENNICKDCPGGMTNDPYDPATGVDTSCEEGWLTTRGGTGDQGGNALAAGTGLWEKQIVVASYDNSSAKALVFKRSDGQDPTLPVQYSTENAYPHAMCWKSRLLVGAEFGPETKVKPDLPFIPGTTISSEGAHDSFISVLYGANYLSYKHLSGPSDIIVKGLAEDGEGNTYAVGRFNETLTLDSHTITSSGLSDTFILKVNTANDEWNAVEWMQRMGSQDNDAFNALAVDSENNIIAVGFHSDVLDDGSSPQPSPVTPNKNILVVKYDSNGTRLWRQSFGGIGDDEALAVAVDSNDEIYVTGYTHQPRGSSLQTATSTTGIDKNIFVLKLNPTTGEIASEYANSIIWGSEQDDEARGIAYDATRDQVVVVGFFSETITSVGGNPITAYGGTDIFVARFSLTSAHGSLPIEAMQAGGNGNDHGNAVVIKDSSIYITGSFQKTAQFGPKTRTATDGEDLFLWRLTF